MAKQAVMGLKQASEETRRSPREYQTDSVLVVQDTANYFGKTPRSLATEMGYSDTAWNGWAKSGRMPLVAAKLCRAMVASDQQAKASQGLAGDEVVMLVRVRGEANRTMLGALAKGLGLEFVVV